MDQFAILRFVNRTRRNETVEQAIIIIVKDTIIGTSEPEPTYLKTSLSQNR